MLFSSQEGRAALMVGGQGQTRCLHWEPGLRPDGELTYGPLACGGAHLGLVSQFPHFTDIVPPANHHECGF